MPRAAKIPFENIRELLDRLGNVPPERVCLDPPPGQATKRELLRLHERSGRLYELVDGTLVEKPMGSPEAFLAAELIRLFGRYLDAHDIGFLYAPDALIEVLPDLVRGPDVSFVPWPEGLDRSVPRKPISKQIPALVVEVLSPSNRPGEIRRKLKEYFLAGVRLVWVVSPDTETAVVYTAPDVKTPVPTTGTLDGGDVLPGFRLPLAKLFERLEKPAAKKRRKK